MRHPLPTSHDHNFIYASPVPGLVTHNRYFKINNWMKLNQHDSLEHNVTQINQEEILM